MPEKEEEAERIPPVVLQVAIYDYDNKRKFGGRIELSPEMLDTNDDELETALIKIVKNIVREYKKGESSKATEQVVNAYEHIDGVGRSE